MKPTAHGSGEIAARVAQFMHDCQQGSGTFVLTAVVVIGKHGTKRDWGLALTQRKGTARELMGSGCSTATNSLRAFEGEGIGDDAVTTLWRCETPTLDDARHTTLNALVAEC